MAITAASKISAVVIFAVLALLSAVASAQESPAPAPAPALDRGSAALPAAASIALLCTSFFLSLPAIFNH